MGSFNIPILPFHLQTLSSPTMEAGKGVQHQSVEFGQSNGDH